MPEFIRKPRTVTAERFDGVNLLPGMFMYGDGSFCFTDNWDSESFLEKGDWIVEDEYGVKQVYDQEQFQKQFCPVE